MGLHKRSGKCRSCEVRELPARANGCCWWRHEGESACVLSGQPPTCWSGPSLCQLLPTYLLSNTYMARLQGVRVQAVPESHAAAGALVACTILTAVVLPATHLCSTTTASTATRQTGGSALTVRMDTLVSSEQTAPMAASRSKTVGLSSSLHNFNSVYRPVRHTSTLQYPLLPQVIIILQHRTDSVCQPPPPAYYRHSWRPEACRAVCQTTKF